VTYLPEVSFDLRVERADEVAPRAGRALVGLGLDPTRYRVEYALSAADVVLPGDHPRRWLAEVRAVPTGDGLDAAARLTDAAPESRLTAGGLVKCGLATCPICGYDP